MVKLIFEYLSLFQLFFKLSSSFYWAFLGNSQKFSSIFLWNFKKNPELFLIVFLTQANRAFPANFPELFWFESFENFPTVFPSKNFPDHSKNMTKERPIPSPAGTKNPLSQKDKRPTNSICPSKGPSSFPIQTKHFPYCTATFVTLNHLKKSWNNFFFFLNFLNSIFKFFKKYLTQFFFSKRFFLSCLNFEFLCRLFQLMLKNLIKKSI